MQHASTYIIPGKSKLHSQGNGLACKTLETWEENPKFLLSLGRPRCIELLNSEEYPNFDALKLV